MGNEMKNARIRNKALNSIPQGMNMADNIISAARKMMSKRFMV